MKFIKGYAEKHYPFPNRDVPKDQKSEPEYVRAVAESIYSRHVKNRTGISYTYSTIFDQLRKYGRGMQDEAKYKDYLSGANVDSNNNAVTALDGSWTQNRRYERRGWMNVLWDIVSPAVKIRNMVQGLFVDVDYDVMVDAIDADSGAEEEDRKWRTWATTRTFIRTALDRLKIKAGVPVQAPQIVPESIEELELYEAMGSFKQGYSMALEKLIRHTDDVSDWDSLKRKLVDDIIDLNVCVAKCDYSEDEKKVRWRYVDPQDTVIQYSKYEDFKDSEYAGEFRDINISQLRRALLKEGYTESDISNLAEEYSGYRGNPAKNEWQDYNSMASNNSWNYDHFKTCVFVFEWIDDDTEKKIRYKNKHGKIRWLPYKEGQKIGNREKLVKTTKKSLYQGHWVVGTDIVYDIGPVNYQPRPAPNRVELTYKAFKIEGKSLMGLLIPILDNFQISWLRYQNALNTVYEEGYAVDFRLLQNISDGDKKFSAREAIKMWKETGILPFMSTPVGQFYRGGSVLPAHPLPGGMGDALNQAIGRLQLLMRYIEEVTGLSPISLGAQPEKDTPVGTTERSLQATHTALKPLYNSIFYIKSNLGVITGTRIQQLLKYDKESKKQYAKVVGEQDVQSIVMARDCSAEYGFRMEARPTQQDKIHLMRYIEIAMAPGRDGRPGIEMADATYMIERLLAGGNLKEIRLYLVQAQRKSKREAFRQQQALVKQQQEGLQRLEQMKAEKEARSKDLETRSAVAVDNNKHRNDVELLMLKLNTELVRSLTSESKREKYAEE